jgi:hypothetical protein
VPDTLQCDWPFEDIGMGHCVDPEPEVNGIEVHMLTTFGDVDRQPWNLDDGNIVDLPAQWTPPDRHRQLYVTGRWLTTPLTISVVDQVCRTPMLHGATRHCSADGLLCRDYASATCCMVSPGLVHMYTD